MVDLQASPLMQLEQSLKILRQHNIAPDHLHPDSPNDERLFFMPMLLAVNKDDDDTFDEDFDIFCELLDTECPLIPISIKNKRS